MGIDLHPIRAIPGVVTVQADIKSAACREAIKKTLGDSLADCIMHDGAPDLGGTTWSKDAYTQIELVVHSLKLATQFLRAGGMFITKVFRSQDYHALQWCIKQFFKKVHVHKPSASRSASAEIFLICKSYLAPSQIDKRLLDPNHIFRHIEEPKKVKDVMHKKKKADQIVLDMTIKCYNIQRFRLMNISIVNAQLNFLQNIIV